MTDKKKLNEQQVLNQGKGLIKKCKELDKAMSLSKKKAKDLIIEESRELQNLGNKLLRWCIK